MITTNAHKHCNKRMNGPEGCQRYVKWMSNGLYYPHVTILQNSERGYTEAMRGW
jgi:hypothetical protein